MKFPIFIGVVLAGGLFLSCPPLSSQQTLLPPRKPSLSGFISALLPKLMFDKDFGPIVLGIMANSGDLLRLVGSAGNSNLTTNILALMNNADFKDMLNEAGTAFEGIKLPNTTDSSEIILSFVGQAKWMHIVKVVSGELSKNQSFDISPTIGSIAQTVSSIVNNPGFDNITTILKQEFLNALPPNGSLNFDLQDFLDKFNLWEILDRILTQVDLSVFGLDESITGLIPTVLNFLKGSGITPGSIYALINDPDLNGLLDKVEGYFTGIKLPNTTDKNEIILSFVGQVDWLGLVRDVLTTLGNSATMPVSASIKGLTMQVSDILNNQLLQQVTGILRDAFVDALPPNGDVNFELKDFLNRFSLVGVAERLLTDLDPSLLGLGDSVLSVAKTVVQVLKHVDVQTALNIIVKHLGNPALVPPSATSDEILGAMLFKLPFRQMLKEVMDSGIKNYLRVEWSTIYSYLTAVSVKTTLEQFVGAGSLDILQGILPEAYAYMEKHTLWDTLYDFLSAPSLDAFFGKLFPQIVSIVENRFVMGLVGNLLYEITEMLNNVGSSMDADQFLSAVAGNLLGMLQRTITQLDLTEVIAKPQGVSNQCWNETQVFLYGMQNSQMWGIKMFDAWGKPRSGINMGNLHWLGSYDECERIQEHVNVTAIGLGDRYSLKGRACRLDIMPPYSMQKQVKEAIWLDSPQIKGRNETVSLSVCLPRACKEPDVGALVEGTGLLGLLDMEMEHVECWTGHDDNEPQSFVVIGVYAAIIAFTLVCSFIDAFHISKEPETPKKKKLAEINDGFQLEELPPKNGSVNGRATAYVNGAYAASYGASDDEEEEDTLGHDLMPDKSVPFAHQMIRCFSLYTVVPMMLSGKKEPWNIPCINGIRFLSMAWIMLVHTLGFQAVTYPGIMPNNNLIEALDWLRGADFMIILQGEFSIDSFLVISAVLTCYSFCHCINKTNGKPTAKALGYYYVHRFWRLTPIYAVVLFFASYLHAGDGPMWPLISPQADCRANWWKNLLYINNFFDQSANDACFKWTWALCLVVQLYIVAPLFMLPLYLFQVVGVSFIILGVTGCSAATAYFYDRVGGGLIEEEAYYQEVWVKPYTRGGPYLIGLLIGYLMFKRRHERHMNLIVALIGWALALVVVNVLIYAPFSEYCEGCEKWPHWSRVLWEALKRPAWGAAVGFMILACFSNKGGVINSILSWEGFVPLSRLSYAAFLLHPVIMFMFTYNRRTALIADKLTLTMLFGSFLVLTYILAGIFSAFFEIPFRLWERTLAKRRHS